MQHSAPSMTQPEKDRLLDEWMRDYRDDILRLCFVILQDRMLAEDASQEVIECGSTKDALWYEVNDMEEAVSGAADEMHFDYTVDVMNVMTEIRKAWGLSYPEERESL